MQAARVAWQAAQRGPDPAKLVFIDETWATTNMARRYGRSKRGERLICHVPGGHWKTTTFIAALRHDRITAPAVFDGPINGDTFLAWIRQVLVPTLSSGDTVVMDNLSSHKVVGVKEAIEAVGAYALARNDPTCFQKIDAVFWEASAQPRQQSAFSEIC